MFRRKPGVFDTFLFADYSGAESESAQRAAISLFRVDRERSEPRKVHGPHTRLTLRDELLAQLESATKEDRRVLFGLDHQWSWPRDLRAVAGLGVGSWRRFLERLVKGTKMLPPLDSASRYGGGFNTAVGCAVFHCRVHTLAKKYGVPTSSTWSGSPIRLTETLMPGAKPATRLGGTGSVAGQTLAGLKELHFLFAETERRGLPVKAWPFDILHDDGSSHIGCEIYPAFAKRQLAARGLTEVQPQWSEHDRDAALTCFWASQTILAPLLDLRRGSRDTRQIAVEEGWILGANPNGVV